MSFNLMISNPPYGKSSSLSKKIVNKMLEYKVAEEMVVLAPPKSFQDKLYAVASKIDIGLTSDHFDIPVANGVKVFICKMILDKESNEDWEHFLLSEKELVYLKAVENYNKNKVYPFETPGWVTTYAKSKGILKDIEESRIVLFGIYYPKYLSAGWLQSSGEAEEHNLRGKAIRYHDSSSAPWALVFKTQEEAKGFCNFYYKGIDENKAGKVFTFGFSILRKLYGDDPSSKKYQMILPALDWSKSWTDAEILKEIGLPGDFLEE